MPLLHRPLPQEMESYARDDTHYLLFIYDRMRNELIRRGDRTNHLLHTVLRRSRDVCLRQYKKPTFSESSYLQLYYKHKRKFNSRQVRMDVVELPWGLSGVYGCCRVAMEIIKGCGFRDFF